MTEIHNIQQNMVKLQKDIEYIKVSLTNNKEDHKEMLDKIDNWINSCEKKFAPKWVEKVLVWCGISIGGVLIISLLNLIIK